MPQTTETTTTMLDRVKMALRVKTNAFDNELTDLIGAACGDLGIVGVSATSATSDPLLIRAIVTFCRFAFGAPDDYDRLKASYDEQKAMLKSCTGYGING